MIIATICSLWNEKILGILIRRWKKRQAQTEPALDVHWSYVEKPETKTNGKLADAVL